MSVLTETSTFDATVNQIDDGDNVDHIVLNAGPQALANRTKYLNDKKAPIDSPAFTGTPTCPTPAAGTSTQQIINAEYIANLTAQNVPPAAAETGSVGASLKHAREDHVHPANLSSSASDMQMNGTASAGTSSKPARANHVHPTDSSRAPLASPAFTGTPTTPTPSSGDSSKQVANTEFVIGNGLPAGTVIYTARTTAPSGYLKANGAQVSRTTYAALFAAIGTTFGIGDGSTTFNLPDMRGVFPRGYDDGRGLDTGRSFGNLQGDAIRNITGTMLHIQSAVANSIFADGSFRAYQESSYGNTTAGGAPGFNVDFDASRVVPTATENRPYNIALLACIKY